MAKPGKVPGPVRVKPNKKSDLTDYRRAKRVQDYLNWAVKREAERAFTRYLMGDDESKR